MFNGESAIKLKEEFKEKFRNISKIMDCVGCDKCRLWGKLQVSGLTSVSRCIKENKFFRRFHVLVNFQSLLTK
jgi:hypothetical protein